MIRQPFRLDKTVIRVLKDAGSFLVVYLNEYNVMSNAFVLQINPTEQAQWLTAFEKAKVGITGCFISLFQYTNIFVDTLFGPLMWTFTIFNFSIQLFSSVLNNP